MARSRTVPAEPVAEPSAEPQAGLDTTELRVTEQPSLDDAAPVADPEDDQAPPADRRLNRHDEAMAAIVQSRRARLEAERAEAHAQGFPDQGPTEPEAPSLPEEARSEPAAPSQRAAASADPAPAADPAAPVRTQKILVRGNEIVMSDDDMRRAAELGVESEARIRHANAVLEEARRVAASGQSIPGAGPSPPAAPPPSPVQEPPSDRDAMRELARELLYGDEEKVVDALIRARQPVSHPQPVDPEALARDVYARVDSRLGQQRSLETALQTFGSEYTEIVNDPDLATLAANYVQQLRAHYAQTQTPRTELDLFREAGNATRQAMARWSGGAAPQPATAPAPAPQPAAGQSRVTVKRNTPQAPTAAAAQQATPAPRQKTGTDIVNEMRRARGQPVYA